MQDFKDIKKQLKIVLSGKSPVVDFFIPTLTFLIVNWLIDLKTAILISTFAGILLALRKILKKQSALPNLIGLLIGLIVAGLSYINEVPELLIYQDIIYTVLTLLALIISIIFKKPLVALTSRVVRKWPADWYSHKKVQPAYLEVTWIWIVFYLGRLIIQIILVADSVTAKDFVINTLFGWPLVIFLLIISYLYGIKRLKQLKGPSIEEFKNNTSPPWKSQQSGF